jgi:2-amino-4-hydroxy-6-hydroxymethyldihydropteridine diphosphokinase
VTHAVVALGANLGDRHAVMHAALAAVDMLPGTTVTAVSTFRETVALTAAGLDESKPAYLNAVATLDTELSAHALLAHLHEIEAEHGRVRAERWGDRTLDLDLIVWGDLIEDGNLVVPHPRAHERDFVLEPWFEIEPDAVLPGHGPIRDLVREVHQ